MLYQVYMFMYQDDLIWRYEDTKVKSQKCRERSMYVLNGLETFDCFGYTRLTLIGMI